MSDATLLVTGAAGMVGQRVVQQALQAGHQVRALVRSIPTSGPLADLDVQWVKGDLGEPDSLLPALNGAHYVVHTAAHVGDWGPAEKYRAINVVALEHMLTAVEAGGTLRRWIQISSLGVYPARHHFGSDESVAVDVRGLDGYTRTKAEAEVLLRQHIDQFQLPAVILRPGFIYGPGDRHVVPRLVERLQAGKMKIIGDGQRELNNTYVGNLVDAIFLAIDCDDAVGEVFNVRDHRLVTREEFIGRIADYLQLPRPGNVPEWVARLIVGPIEGWARWTGATEAPMLTRARIKFMTLNLNFSIDKARRVLGYRPKVDFQEGIGEAMDRLMQGPPARQVSAKSA